MKKGEIIVGIDPGKDGAFVFLNKYGNVIYKFVTPNKDGFIDVLRIYSILEDLKEDIKHIYLEEVHGIPGASSKSTFNFGGVYWVTRVILILLRLPYTLVQPKKWQGVMFSDIPEQRKPDIKIKKGKQKGKVRKGNRDTKKMALMACQEMFPKTDLRKNDRCKIPHDGICDALLIAEYGRKQSMWKK